MRDIENEDRETGGRESEKGRLCALYENVLFVLTALDVQHGLHVG